MGLAAAVMLLVLAFGAMRSGSRIQARAESKLAATGECELVFRQLGRDLSSALQPPRVAGNEIEVATASAPSVTWTFTAASGGRGSSIERVAGTDRTRHLLGSLVAVGLNEVATGGRTSISLALTSRGLHDAAPAQFRETFFLRGVSADPEWNPIR